MIKKVLAGAALAVSATMAIAAPASAADCKGVDSNESAQGAINSYHMDGGGDTASGEGTYGSHYGDTVAGHQDGAINNNGAPFVGVDLRCAVANATGVAGDWGNKNSCNEAPVDQFQKGGILGG
ncbi:hypothetical protein [Streptacidiphilus cavernicola]|uniref:Secreted protein n=1 Tax=Streptacidiphilus cavernicola TaxID=3342716 RepID=A0ABV6W1Q9_9ACTN